MYQKKKTHLSWKGNNAHQNNINDEKNNQMHALFFTAAYINHIHPVI